MKKPLTRAQAWRAIAEKLLTEGCVRYGICYEVSTLELEGRISIETEDTMRNQIEQHGPDYYDENDNGPWAYEPGQDHEERALACLWMALEAV